MNLWFRLMALLLTRPWRRPVGGLETTVIRMRVWPSDLDLNRHVTNGRYFNMADIGRMDYIVRSGAFRVALRHKAAPIVGDVWGKFRRELRLFEQFEIHTRMLAWDDKWTFMEHRFVRHGRVVGVVVMRGLFRAPGALVPPAAFAKELGIDPQSPPLPQWLATWSASCDAQSQALRDEEAVPR